uniref:Uncharacterized protein n=1 Tax=Erpetoichthys calabaricus TaxID=27687 RepID=A0A8C4SP03_ERPCA
SMILRGSYRAYIIVIKHPTRGRRGALTVFLSSLQTFPGKSCKVPVPPTFQTTSLQVPAPLMTPLPVQTTSLQVPAPLMTPLPVQTTSVQVPAPLMTPLPVQTTSLQVPAPLMTPLPVQTTSLQVPAPLMTPLPVQTMSVQVPAPLMTPLLVQTTVTPSSNLSKCLCSSSITPNWNFTEVPRVKKRQMGTERRCCCCVKLSLSTAHNSAHYLVVHLNSIFVLWIRS